MFFQNLLNDISAILEKNLARNITKLRSTCAKYYQVKPYFEFSEVVPNLSNDKEIVILKPDKDRGVAILHCSKYMKKCLSSQFAEIDHDPTVYIEGKVQGTLRKIENKLPSFLYSNIYLTGSTPRKYYGTTKVSNNSTVKQLPLRPIISNIGTATYNLAKYLAQLLKPLTKLQYTINNNKTFTKKLKKITVPPEYKLVSLDVLSLFTNVALDETIDIIIKRIYDKREVNIDIRKKKKK